MPAVIKATSNVHNPNESMHYLATGEHVEQPATQTQKAKISDSLKNHFNQPKVTHQGDVRYRNYLQQGVNMPGFILPNQPIRHQLGEYHDAQYYNNLILHNHPVKNGGFNLVVSFNNLDWRKPRDLMEGNWIIKDFIKHTFPYNPVWTAYQMDNPNATSHVHLAVNTVDTLHLHSIDSVGQTDFRHLRYNIDKSVDRWNRLHPSEHLETWKEWHQRNSKPKLNLETRPIVHRFRPIIKLVRSGDIDDWYHLQTASRTNGVIVNLFNTSHQRLPWSANLRSDVVKGYAAHLQHPNRLIDKPAYMTGSKLAQYIPGAKVRDIKRQFHVNLQHAQQIQSASIPLEHISNERQKEQRSAIIRNTALRSSAANESIASTIERDVANHSSADSEFIHLNSIRNVSMNVRSAFHGQSASQLIRSKAINAHQQSLADDYYNSLLSPNTEKESRLDYLIRRSQSIKKFNREFNKNRAEKFHKLELKHYKQFNSVKNRDRAVNREVTEMLPNSKAEQDLDKVKGKIRSKEVSSEFSSLGDDLNHDEQFTENSLAESEAEQKEKNRASEASLDEAINHNMASASASASQSASLSEAKNDYQSSSADRQLNLNNLMTTGWVKSSQISEMANSANEENAQSSLAESKKAKLNQKINSLSNEYSSAADGLNESEMNDYKYNYVNHHVDEMNSKANSMGEQGGNAKLIKYEILNEAMNGYQSSASASTADSMKAKASLSSHITSASNSIKSVLDGFNADEISNADGYVNQHLSEMNSMGDSETDKGVNPKLAKYTILGSALDGYQSASASNAKVRQASLASAKASSVKESNRASMSNSVSLSVSQSKSASQASFQNEIMADVSSDENDDLESNYQFENELKAQSGLKDFVSEAQYGQASEAVHDYNNSIMFSNANADIKASNQARQTSVEQSAAKSQAVKTRYTLKVEKMSQPQIQNLIKFIHTDNNYNVIIKNIKALQNTDRYDKNEATNIIMDRVINTSNGFKEQAERAKASQSSSVSPSTNSGNVKHEANSAATDLRDKKEAEKAKKDKEYKEAMQNIKNKKKERARKAEARLRAERDQGMSW